MHLVSPFFMDCTLPLEHHLLIHFTIHHDMGLFDDLPQGPTTSSYMP